MRMIALSGADDTWSDEVNDVLLGRGEVLRALVADIRAARTAAFLIEGSGGCGRSAFARTAARRAAGPGRAFYLPRHEYAHKYDLAPAASIAAFFEPRGGILPPHPLCAQATTQNHQKEGEQPSSSPIVVVVDDVVNLKHYALIKMLTEHLLTTAAATLAAGAPLAFVYLIVVDHMESRPQSQLAQRMFQYVHMGGSAAAPTLASVLRAREFAAAGERVFGWTHEEAQRRAHAHFFAHGAGVAEQEKDVVAALFRDVGGGEEEKKAAPTTTTTTTTLSQRVQRTDARQVALHLLENVPAFLAGKEGGDPTATLCAVRDVYGLFAATDVDMDLCTSPLPPAATHLLQQITTSVRILGSQRLLATTTTTPCPSTMSFTKLPTRHSSALCDAAFLHACALRCRLTCTRELMRECMRPHDEDFWAPIHLDTKDAWARYAAGHPFLRVHYSRALSQNDARRVFRHLYLGRLPPPTGISGGARVMEATGTRPRKHGGVPPPSPLRPRKSRKSSAPPPTCT